MSFKKYLKEESLKHGWDRDWDSDMDKVSYPDEVAKIVLKLVKEKLDGFLEDVVFDAREEYDLEGKYAEEAAEKIKQKILTALGGK